MNIPFLALSGAAFFAAAAALFFFCSTSKNEVFHSIFRALPRSRSAGSVLSAIVIFWCVPNIRPVIGPVEWFQNLLIPCAIVAVVAVSVYLDYLFARAFAGFLILGAHALLKEIFPLSLPGYPVYALLLMLTGVLGIVLSAKPHYFRLWLEHCAVSRVLRFGSTAFFVILSLVSIAYLIFVPSGI